MGDTLPVIGYPAIRALQSLIEEHQLVSRVLGALSAYADRLKGKAPVDIADLAAFAKVFRELADQLHHAKEEHILLPLLARHGFDWNSGVLPLVRLEHRQESSLIDELGQAGQQPSWSKEERRRVVATATALVRFQRNHHQMENTQLFPAVALRLSTETLARIQAELEAFDAEGHRQASRAAVTALAYELIERYTPATVALSSEARRETPPR